MKSKMLLFTCLLSLPVIVNAQKTTILKSRMIGATYRIAANATVVYINDSDVYKYSGLNTGAPKNTGTAIANNWTYSGKYDTLTRRRYDTVASHPPHYFLRDRTFDHYTGTNNNMDTTTYQTYDTTALAYTNKYRTINTFDGSNNLKTALTQYWIASAWHDSTEHWYTYDGSNNLIADTSKNLSNATQNRLTLYYYATGVLDSTVVMTTNAGNFVNSTKTAYFLNAGHKPDSTVNYSWAAGAWGYTGFGILKDHYIYDGSYNTLIDSQFFYNAGSWNLFTVNEYTYSGSDMTADTLSQAFGGPFRNYYYWVNTYDGSHNQLTSEKYTWLPSSSTWRDTALVTNTYNSYYQLTSYGTQTKVGGTWVMTRIPGGGGYSDAQNNFYYETYNDPTGVPTTTAKNGSLKLYPVPANNMLNIDLSWDNTQSSVLAIYDMTGRLWMQWASDNTANYKHTVYISQLPAGNYIMKVKGEDAQAAQPFVIVR